MDGLTDRVVIFDGKYDDGIMFGLVVPFVISFSLNSIDFYIYLSVPNG